MNRKRKQIHYFTSNFSIYMQKVFVMVSLDGKNGSLTFQICKRFSWRGAGKFVLKKDPLHIGISKIQYFFNVHKNK